MTLPKVSIIIVNYNGKLLLEKCLESLFKINYNNFEVVIVDNNSTDNTIEFITKNYPSIIIIKLDSNKGFAEPNNIAAKITKGDYLLFLNNDTIVTPNFISEMIKTMENDKKIGICQSLLLKSDGQIDSSGDFMDDLGIVYNSKTKIDSTREIFSARGASLIILKNIFDNLGGFDEKFFFSFEDVDLSWRVRINGYKILVVQTSIVHHLGGGTSDKISSDLTFHSVKNQISMKITNFETYLVVKVLFLFLLRYGFREIKILFDYIINGKTTITSTNYEDKIAAKPNIRGILKGMFWLFSNIPYLFTKHRSVNKMRKISTDEFKKTGLMTRKIK